VNQPDVTAKSAECEKILSAQFSGIKDKNCDAVSSA
jgi:hypothetical protein